MLSESESNNDETLDDIYEESQACKVLLFASFFQSVNIQLARPSGSC